MRQTDLAKCFPKNESFSDLFCFNFPQKYFCSTVTDFNYQMIYEIIQVCYLETKKIKLCYVHSDGNIALAGVIEYLNSIPASYDTKVYSK